MLPSFEACPIRAAGVHPLEGSQEPPPPPFAALEGQAQIDIIYLVELYPIRPGTLTIV